METNQSQYEKMCGVYELYQSGKIAPVIHAKKIHAHSQGGATHWFVCGHCEKPVDSDDKYCRHCGAKLDGEG